MRIRHRRDAVIDFLLLLLVVGYGTAYLVQFWSTPFGRVPVLDAEENVLAARQLLDGTLPAEPYYRAMLYPAILAGLLWIGLPLTRITLAAGALGLACHIFSTVLVHRSASILWGRPGRAWPPRLAAVLFGLNPVAVYFAGEVLDATLALTLALVGVLAVLQAREASSVRKAIGWGSLSAAGFALATLARPHFLAPLVAAPVSLFFTSRDVGRRASAAFAIVAVTCLLGGGAVQKWHVGHFAVLPWQGAYNLWAANKPSANGRYFAQESATAGAGEQRNPARVESERLYERETGRPAGDVAAMNDHWTGRFVSHVTAHPAAWLGLMARKVYYLLNDSEQYNNKTYSFQKGLSPWLRWNPLGWGSTFVLAVVGACILFLQKDRAGAARLLLLLAGAYAAGALLYFPSDRFRLPLLPIACMFAGGVSRVGELRRATAGARAGVAAAAGLAGALAFSGLLDVRDDSTWVMDKVLLASAASRVGDDALAARTVFPLLSDGRVGSLATPLFVESYTNLRMEPEWRSAAAAFGEWVDQDPIWRGPVRDTPELRYERAVHAWNRGRRQEAVQLWRTVAADPRDGKAAHALACLLLVGELDDRSSQIVNEYVTGARPMDAVLFAALTNEIDPSRLTPAQAELVRSYSRLLRPDLTER